MGHGRLLGGGLGHGRLLLLSGLLLAVRREEVFHVNVSVI